MYVKFLLPIPILIFYQFYILIYLISYNNEVPELYLSNKLFIDKRHGSIYFLRKSFH